MINKYARGIQHTQSLSLRRCCINKFARSYRNRRSALDFEPYRVMQTARGTGSSVGEGLNDKVIVLQDLLAQCIWRGFGKCGLGVALELNLRQALL